MFAEPRHCHYFVDEAGDPVLFNRRKEAVVGNPGCSKFFMLGLLDVENCTALASDLSTLRRTLIADPYFRDVPSMQPETGKTAIAFHAKDDLPEVRREVFAALLRHPVRFFAVVRNKHNVLAHARQQNKIRPHYRYSQNELYDALTTRLFRDRLHKDQGYTVCFSRRGSSDRTAALREALNAARRNMAKKWKIVGTAPIGVLAGASPQHPGLQAVDYFLWALQRLYESHEDRFVKLLWEKISLVHDVDDTRTNSYGVYYTKERPLTADRLPDA